MDSKPGPGFRGAASTTAIRGPPARQRGIYSDFPSSQELPVGPSSAYVHSGLVRTRTALGFQPSESATAKLESKLHAAAEVHVSKAVEPKVFVPHERRPGLPPRKVEVERKKRFYASQDVVELLKAEGVDSSVNDASLDVENGSLYSFLPLSMFDNTEYEIRSPAQWMALLEADAADSKLDDVTGLPARALDRGADGTGSWKPCKVTGYSGDADKYSVTWDEGGGTAALHRLDICFAAEDPFNFAQRVGAATRARKEAAAVLRYNLYVDCMPSDDAPKLDSEQCGRIVASALTVKQLQHLSGRAHAILKEVNMDFTRTMNKIIFDLFLEHATGEGLMASVAKPPKRIQPPAPEVGVIRVPAHDFPQQFSDFSFHSHLTRLEVIGAVQRVLTECQRVLKASLLNTTVSKSARLDEFEHGQNTTITVFTTMLQETWAVAIKNHIKSSLKDVGKGWFNLKDTNRELYDFSKLKRFLTMVNFMMQDTLRFSVMENLQKYTEYLLVAAEGEVVVESTNKVITDFSASKVEQRHRRPPLFLIEIEIVPDGTPVAPAAPPAEDTVEAKESVTDETSGASRPPPPPVLAQRLKFSYSVPLDSFRDVPVKVFDTALGSLQKLVQVERLVMDKLFWSHDPVMQSVHPSETWVDAYKKQVQAALDKCLPVAKQYLSTLNPYTEFLNLDVDLFMQHLAYKNRETFDLASLRSLITEHRAAASQVLDQLPVFVNVGLFSVSLADVRAALSKKYTDIADKIVAMVLAYAVNTATTVCETSTAICSSLAMNPGNIEQLTEIKEFQNTIPDKVRDLEASIQKANDTYALLAQFRVIVPKDKLDLQWDAFGAPKRIAERMAATDALLEKEKSRYMGEMADEQHAFMEHLNSVAAEVANLARFNDLKDVDKAYAVVTGIKKQLEAAAERGRLFNSREGLFGRDLTEYEIIGQINKAFEPYLSLWETTANWLKWHKSWLQDSFLLLNPEVIEKNHANAQKNMARCVRAFEKLEVDGCTRIAVKIRDEIEEFRPHIPLIGALRNPGMRERHWKELSGLIGFDVTVDDKFTLTKVFQLGLAQHIEVISKVGERAGKEYQIEQALDKMAADWEDVNLFIDGYRETGTFILKGVDDMQALLDEHVTMTQAMQFSAFKKPFEERIDSWAETLSTVSDVLEEWIKVQRSWLYLQPIFDSGDIQKQLPLEYKRFSTVDKNWRQTLAAAKQHPKAIKFCANEKLLEKFQESNKFLDLVQKGLSDYLETKRAAFARFYFLSNDELLEILSQTKDPKRVQPHLKKCFEGIRSVRFSDQLEILSMISAENEEVPFLSKIDPKGKNVELWMNEVEDGMRQAFKKTLWDSILNYVEIPRTEWIQAWPGQAVLNGSQLHWTREIEEGVNTEGKIGVKKCLDRQLQQLQDMVKLVRGKLERLVRLTMGALTVIDVHARDVTKTLVEAGVSSVNDFEWISQMRYYWRGDQSLSGDMFVMMVSSERPYGYEYLGNSLRLVITPLTDKCYMTLMGALQMELGGAPAGPAGTGKTESVKDLAKALAKQCVVFNCSDGLDYLAMGKFFKGLASCGAWACFDEFNRIDVEVLSVIAQQIMTLQAAIKSGTPRIIFEDSDIAVSAQFAVFITMNPGYAGRTELPDNLKVLFRPVAMMVPDYAMIGEIMLFSFGFEKGLSLANKMVTSFKLCSEQLSSQDHYDYGMRAVKTVITAAGNLKQQDPDMDEDKLLLRALQDVNLPKFLSFDLPLYQGIMSDLFPGVTRPEIDYGDMEMVLKQVAESSGLQPVPVFITKCTQLYETVVVRHGLMLVGATGGGKTMILNTLQSALTILKDSGRSGPKVQRTHTRILNPKAITSGQLYGESDKNTQEWNDGIVAILIRECARTTTPDNKWVVFDGPVDAVWIENMNTVLDDNKKLCLVSGEIIPLSEEMNLIFEVEDLAVASPATVSRCGMVYTEPSSLGLDPLILSWLDVLPPCFKPAMKAKLLQLFDSYLQPTLYFLRRHLTEPVPTVDNQLCRGLMNILDCFFEPFAQKEARDPPTAEDVAALTKDLPSLFIFALVWSAAATTNRAGRKRMDAFIRNEMSQLGFGQLFPEQGLVYDYAFDLASHKWMPWMQTVPEYVLNPKLSFAELIIPTKDSVRYKFLARLLLTNNKFVLMTGPTGTGKTANLTELLSSGMPEEFIPLNLTFSAQTSANQTQDIIDGKMEKRRRGVFGPSAGTKYILFVDDLNMPQREKYFAQPPIELLRQWCNYGGWYDRKERVFKKIIDTILLGAMGPPGGGRNPVTARLIRYFNVITYTEMDDESMFLIFNTILTSFLSGFDASVQAVCQNVVKSTISVYNTIVDELLPTPAKPHYTFNLRDLAKVFQGCLMADAKKVPDVKDFLRLWVHECRRVFQDRLVNDADRAWFDSKTRRELESTIGVPWADVVTSDRLIFGDYMVPGADPRIYEEVKDIAALVPTIEEYLSDFNAESKSPMKLVMFLDAIEHVSRIARILRQPQGNALLFGVGGSGRQSLTKLATFIADYDLFQVEIAKGYGQNEWRDDLKSCLMKAGIDTKPTVFLFSDTQIIFEGMLEDVNNVLNSGDVPNLYGPEELETIMSTCRRDCLAKRIQPTKINIFAQYLIRVRQNIHVVVTMSPMGDAFSSRLRMFPGLVNCCTIDWFSEWPDDALVNVAMQSLTESDLKLGDELDKVVTMFKILHQSVARKSKEFYDVLRRYNYVTPTSYLELLQTFKSVLTLKREEVGTLRNRLQIGLDKLMSTATAVAKLQEELTAMEPKLVATQKDVEEMIITLEADKKTAAETKITVEKEEAEAQKMAVETKEIAEDAQRDLAEALPALDAAVACLNKLKKGDIDEVRAMKKPPAGVKLVIHATCIMFGVKPVLKPDPDNVGKKIKDYLEAAQKTILSDANKLLTSLKSYDKDNIEDAIIQEVEPFMSMPEFTPEAVDKASKACSGICMWVRAMYKYYTVALQVEPKKKKLAEAQESLDRTMAALNAAQAKLKDVQDRIQELEVTFERTLAQKEQLAHDVEMCRARLIRAQKLIGGLGGEKDRWMRTVEVLGVAYSSVVGDSVVAAGTIAYLGAFTSEFRRMLVEEWIGSLVKTTVPHTEHTNVLSTLANPVEVRAWNIAGLPTDNHSVENGVIMAKARRWPLLIDPQGQANRYIKNLGKDTSRAENGMEVIRQSDKKFLQSLENGVRFGKWILLENVSEKLDAALEPILLQQKFKQGLTEMIKLGDSVVPYNDSFKFFLTTKLPNPHYPPEVAVKVSLLNFTITPKGLEDQMLGVFVVTEMPEMEDKKNTLTLNNARMKKELQEIENKILYLLSNSTGNILDDENLIETLAQSKSTSAEISIKVKEAEETEAEIDATREKYRPVANRASLLYFAISDLSSVDPMYQYSLPWFSALFVNGIRNSEASTDIPTRILNLNNYFTYSMYQNVCRSLFERHKLLFSFLLTSRILQGQGSIDAAEWRFLISGQSGKVAEGPNPSPDWVTDRMWSEVLALGGLPAFHGIEATFKEDLHAFKALFDGQDAHRMPFSDRWERKKLSMLQRMCLLRCLRPDKITLAVQDFVTEAMGERFIQPPPFDLAKCFADSHVASPLIFVLSTGSDPTKAFFNFASQVGMRSKVEGISLGQGQGVLAARLIEEALVKGSWVLLQNCHLAASWMPELERICENIDPAKVSKDFRLWLTSMPTKVFPVSVLQNGVKMTNEPPKGLKSNLKNFYYNLTDEALQATTKSEAFRKLLFGLSFFHANVQDRKKFGPLGWNIPYEFNDSDLEISRRQLEMFLDEYEHIPYKVLNFLTSYINYGGRVTDDKDLRTIDVILKDYFRPDVMTDGYKFSASGLYRTISVDPESPHAGYMTYIDSLPLNPHPEAFGMHANANITSDQNETYELFDILLSLQPRVSSGGGKSRDEQIGDLARDIAARLPPEFNVEAISMQYPVKYEDSMNTVLVQECLRYNKLVSVMTSSLAAIQKALKGLLVMSTELDEMGSSLFNQKVPAMWEAKAYPSMKPLNSWVTELMERLNFISSWIASGPPPVFWISGFVFPQAFLTGTMQNYARRMSFPIDTLSFDFKLVDHLEPESIHSPPDAGCFIRGLYLEGARYDPSIKALNDSLPKQLYTLLPVMHLNPIKDRKPPTANVYMCPVYKILSRQGTLSTTGHSTNFVMYIELPSDRPSILNNRNMADCDVWIKAGVAAFCALRY